MRGIDGPRYRRDGFTPEKKKRWLEAYAETKCIADACGAVPVSKKTFYYHYDKWPEFRAQVDAVTARVASEIENVAWLRATVGAEEKIYREGKLVQVRVKPSDSMLRLLLQARNPKKYGRPSRGGETRKQIEKRVRKQILEEMAARRPSIEDVTEKIIRQVEAIRRHRAREG